MAVERRVGHEMLARLEHDLSVPLGAQGGLDGIEHVGGERDSSSTSRAERKRMSMRSATLGSVTAPGTIAHMGPRCAPR